MTGDELSDIRHRLGLTQTDMTALLNERIPWLRLHRGNLARWETGLVTPSPAMQDALARALASATMDRSSEED